MKLSIGTLAVLLAGYAAANGTSADNLKEGVGRWRISNDMQARDGPNNFFEVKQNIVGTIKRLDNFIGAIDYAYLKQILGDDWGKPFRFNFYNSANNRYVGFLAGYFTTDGKLKLDRRSELPGDVSFPDVRFQPSIAPKPVSVTANEAQTKSIIAAGQVSDQDLQDLLGDDYGKAFVITLTGSGGSQVGTVSGTFSENGIKFDSDSKIPKPTSTSNGNGSGDKPTSTSSDSGASYQTEYPKSASDAQNTGSTTIEGSTGSELSSKLQNLSRDFLLKATGGKFGSFYITFQSSDGKYKGFINGYITPTSYNYNWQITG